MKHTLLIIAVLLSFNLSLTAQKLYTKNGSISFFSKASLENISAENNQVTSALALPAGILQFSALIQGFHFKKSLMEEHFNENYMESSKFPKAIFKGKIKDLSKVNFTADGSYPVDISGDLSMHGVTNQINVAGTLIIRAGVITGTSKFQVKLADYKIKIPGVVKDNIAKIVDVSVSCIYDQKL